MSLPSEKGADRKKKNRSEASRETSPLLHGSGGVSAVEAAGNRRSNSSIDGHNNNNSGASIRVRRSSKSPIPSLTNQHFSQHKSDAMVQTLRSDASNSEHDGYEPIEEANNALQQHRALQSSIGHQSGLSTNRPNIPAHSTAQAGSFRPQSPTDNRFIEGPQPSMLEVPEETYAVRRAALQVLKPLTKTWVVITVGFALTVLFAMARWTGLLPSIPFWFVLLPCWSSHVGLLWLHILSAQALSAFIAEANDGRQRPDSTDHFNRTEYLPLLQRSLKYGLKTGLLSFITFIFEILIYIRLARGSPSLTITFIPLWILVSGGILDGMICKHQHFLRVLCWVLLFTGMVFTVLKVDYHFDSIRWRVVASPFVAVLSVVSGTLIYIVYGHQVGYYRLTESQLAAGNLYSLAALICIVLVVMVGEVIPLSRPVEVETRLFLVVLAPLVVCLAGMGAWVVSRDEFGRLLLYGGQAAVHPMKLKWEAQGWASVQGKGVTVIPMFGEVFFRPLDRNPSQHVVELCTCCSSFGCYPVEEEDDDAGNLGDGIGYHPYLDPTPCSARNYNA